ncbi:MAG: pyruvate kinase, partial [Clostridia bacterium]|nr:pyruvate kinase [Clostridia bacterium]
MKKTKIICTLGPASDSEEVLAALIDAGMNVARLNFSHGTHEEHAEKIAKIKKVRELKKAPIPIMLDTKGPEFRIKTFADGKITLKDGDPFTFTTKDIVGDKTKVAVSFAGICDQMKPGDKILLNNGLMIFEVVKVEKPNVLCKTIIGGELSNRKSMFFPDKELDMVYLSEQDKADLKFGVEQGVDFVACSFVSKAQDIIDVRNWLRECGSPDGEIEIIAKIESRAGVNNLASILEVLHVVMPARGD